MELKVKKLHPNATTPVYATDGSGCFDIYPVEAFKMVPEGCVVVPTGLSFEVPSGYVMLLFSRSGQAFKEDVRLANCVGVIDSDYRGELLVKLRSDSDIKTASVDIGKAVAQAMVLPVQQVTFTEVEELSDTSRGTGGFGSTNKE